MPSLVGVSKLVEARAFDDVGQEVPSPLGPHPMGVAIIDAERIMAMAGDGRTALPPEVRRAFATQGTPSFLIPPSGLGISTRLTGCGW